MTTATKNGQEEKITALYARLSDDDPIEKKARTATLRIQTQYKIKTGFVKGFFCKNHYFYNFLQSKLR